MDKKETNKKTAIKPWRVFAAARSRRVDRRKSPMDALVNDVSLGNLRIFSRWLTRHGSWEKFISAVGGKHKHSA